MGGRYFDKDEFNEYSFSFDLRAWIGRLLFSGKPPRKNGILNFGSGDAALEGYCNADFFTFNVLRRLFRRVIRKEQDWELDFRKPFKCHDNFFDAVFCEHTLEHLKIHDVRHVLKELHRIMKPGALIRVTVPTIEKYIAFYNGQLSDKNFLQWDTKGEAFWSLNHSFGHQCCFDFDFLKVLLEEAGFRECVRREFKEGSDPRLLLDSPERSWETLYVEARKAQI